MKLAYETQPWHGRLWIGCRQSTGVCYTQTHTLGNRLAVAHRFADATEGDAKHIQIVVDDPIINAVDMVHEAPPERINNLFNSFELLTNFLRK